MYEALIPARALPDELFNCVRRFLACNKFIIVDDAYTRMGEAQANAQVGILGQAILIPTAQLLHQFAPHKHRVSTKWRYTGICVKMHR